VAAFHPLRVAAKEQLTDDAVSLTFEVPSDLAQEFAFTAGQHLTLRRELDGVEERRNYSVCAPVGGPLRIGVKRAEGGRFSVWACKELQVGDVVDVLPPLGSFGPRAMPERVGLIAAGSGITPVLSITATALAEGSEVVLLYGNRTSRDVMFLEELADLKDQHRGRFTLVHVLSREVQGSDLLSGRLEGERLARLLEVFGRGVEDWFVCGPLGLVQEASALLNDRGARLHVELFHPAGALPRPVVQPEAGTALTAVLGGRTSTTHLAPGETVLEGVLRVRADAPYACRGGVCGTCRARLVEGEVQMDVNYALEPEELEAGVVLTCQSRPTTEAVKVEYL
jgi:ring-1,2-phenylacetyl-CoA epoxidase subunit PaaE